MTYPEMTVGTHLPQIPNHLARTIAAISLHCAATAGAATARAGAWCCSGHSGKQALLPLLG